MEFKHKHTMAIEDFKRYIDDESVDISVARITFLSTIANSHRFVFTEDVLKEYSKTFLGKYVVASHNATKTDTGSHDGDLQNIIGHIPENQEIQYNYNKDGNFEVSVDVSISKLYSKGIYEILKRDGIKSVSIEALFNFIEEDIDKETGVEDKTVEAFYGTAITVLGEGIKPSVPIANIEMITMSNIEHYEQEYIKYSKNNKIETMSSIESIVQEEIKEERDVEMNISKLAIELGWDLRDTIQGILKEKYPSDEDECWYGKYWVQSIFEEDGQKFAIIKEESGDGKLYKVNFSIENDTVSLSEELVEVKVEFVETNQSNMEMFEKPEEKMADEEEVKAEETKDETLAEDNDNDDDAKEKDDVEEDEMSTLKAELEVYKTKCSEQEALIGELQSFKTEVDNSKKTIIVDETMAKVKGIVEGTKFEVSKFDEYLADSENFSLEDIGAWKNKVIAEVAVFAIDNKPATATPVEFDMGVPTPKADTKKSIYDLL